MSGVAVLVTCEHASSHVPRAYRHLFPPTDRVLRSHRGYDHGALEFARDLAAALRGELLAGRATRLLADLNRQARPVAALSEYTRTLDAREREILLARWHRPYRDFAQAWIEQAVQAGCTVLHVSCHSFTPRLRGRTRTADVGLLYDPQRRIEVDIVRNWRCEILQRSPGLRVRRNYPYRGTSDGLAQYMRSRVPPLRYAGIEVEINQRITRGDPHRWAHLRTLLCQAAVSTVAACLPRAGQNVPG